MGRPRNPVPKYLHHKPSGQARIRVAGKDVYLGDYGSEASKKEYARICAELESKVPAAVVGNTKSKIPKTATVVDVVGAFWEHAAQHYLDADGQPTSELRWFKESLADIVKLYGHVPAIEFGPLALKTVREGWVKADLARSTINARTNRVRRAFKWAASEELIPVSVYQSLATLAGLQKGRTKARETEPVVPVLDLHVATALPHLNRTVRTMVLVQRLSGCRPQDVVRMRAGQVDRAAVPWVYRPPKHKTKYRGQTRTVFLGPAAIAVLEPFLEGRAPEDAVFSPIRAEEERHAAARAKRKTKVTPSQQNRRKLPADLKSPTKELYSRQSYAKWVRKACDKARIPRWHPNQLRHTFGTEIRARFGLEAAQVLLGHTKANVTQVYAERDLTLATKVALLAG